jgi:phosphatidylglycerophosphatase A
VSTLAAGKKTPWAWTVGTFFGVGRIQPGPGTWGSAAAGLLWLAAARGLHLSRTELDGLTIAAILAAGAAGIPAGTVVERESGRADPGCVVIDEVVGQWVALIGSRADLVHLLAAFLFFRFFDILKPWPARRLESLPGGWGIMLDDVAAGVYALLVAQALRNWIG